MKRMGYQTSFFYEIPDLVIIELMQDWPFSVCVRNPLCKRLGRIQIKKKRRRGGGGGGGGGSITRNSRTSPNLTCPMPDLSINVLSFLKLPPTKSISMNGDSKTLKKLHYRIKR